MADIDLETQARFLADLVQYQSGSVVSRTLLSKASGNVTLFAFDSGESLSEHTTPHDALVLCLDGDLQITVAGSARRLNSGDVLVMPANKPHAVHADSRSKMLLVMIHDQAPRIGIEVSAQQLALSWRSGQGDTSAGSSQPLGRIEQTK